MKFNIEILNQYREDDKLISQTHPYYPLIIWNYTQKVQYEELWDDITINCRGLVTDFDGNVISKGFPKFWNLEEGKHIPTKDFEIFEKLDGQYIGAFFYNGELIVNSRGSFTSQYAIAAHDILLTTYPKFINFAKNEYFSITYCFELIGYEQVVVNYPEEDLVLTGIFFNETNIEYDPCNYNWQCDYFEIPIAKKYSGLDYTKIKELNWENCEGFVVRFSNGSRCKVKFEEYCKLHYLMTNLSTTGIWEALSQGKPVTSILQDVPDEFYGKVKEYEESLKFKYSRLENCHIEVFNRVKAIDPPTRKGYAELFKLYNTNQSILFSMLDSKDYSQIIWKIIKPKFEKI